MAADFSLLSSAAQVPMAAGNPMRGFDPVGSTKAAYDIAGKSLEVQEAQKAASEQNTDKQFLQEAMKSGKYDVASPDGISALVKDYGPKLSPSANFKLAQMATATREKDVVFRKHLSGLELDQIKLLQEQEEQTMPFFGQLLDVHGKVKESKGEQDAQLVFQQGKEKILQQLQSQTLPNGQPRFSPQIVERVTQMGPDELTQFYKSSGYRKSLLANELSEAGIAERQERTKALANPQDWQQYTDGSGNSYKWNKKVGVTQVLDKASGQWTAVPALPPDAKPLTGVSSKSGPESPLGKLIADKNALQAAGKLTPEAEAAFNDGVKKATGGSASGKDLVELDDKQQAWLVEYSAGGGKIPNLPMGNSAAGAIIRSKFIKSFVQMHMEQNVSGDDSAKNQLGTKATQRAVGQLKTQAAAIDSTGLTVQKAMDNIETELKRLGGPDSPILRKWMNRSMTEVLGNPEFGALNAYWVEVTEGMAKVLANSSGSAPPAVAYLKLAERALDPNQNLAQFLKQKPALDTLIRNRKEAVQETIKEAEKDTKALVSAKSEPVSQTALDDRAKKYLEITLPQTKNPNLTPDERKQALATARTERAEIIKLGGKVPDITEDIVPPKKSEAPSPYSDAEKERRYQEYKAGRK